MFESLFLNKCKILRTLDYSKVKVLVNFFAIIFLSSCSVLTGKIYPPLEVVSNVDVNKYLGRWYEIARYPNWFQENCFAVTADYELLENGAIKVINQCKDGEPDGKLKKAIGMANIVDSKTNAKLEVSFFWPFYGDYWIIALGDNYEYAVVSEPNREYLWILNRKPTMEEGQYKKLLKVLEKQYFDLSLLIYTVPSDEIVR